MGIVIVPNSANRLSVTPAPDQSIISASRRALSRLPEARRCGSAASKSPSVSCVWSMLSDRCKD